MKKTEQKIDHPLPPELDDLLQKMAEHTSGSNTDLVLVQMRYVFLVIDGGIEVRYLDTILQSLMNPEE